MKIIGLIIFFGSIILFEAPRLVKEKMWGELMAFSGLLLFSIVISVAAVLNLNMPNPTEFIEWIFNPVSEALISIFEPKA